MTNSQLSIVVVIPERLGSSRYPGKPFADICGVPMVGHIYARSKMAAHIDGVYVASPDQEVLDYVLAKGGKVGLEPTPPMNAPTTITKALPDIEKDFGREIDWIIMVQGDEPMITPQVIDELADYVRANPHRSVVNIVAEVRNEKEYFDPNIVKIVLNQNNEGMWFFRTPSERWRDTIQNLPIKKQTGIIAFKREFLVSFGAGEKSPMEKLESVDMFRLVDKGETVPVILSEKDLYSVDTPEDRTFIEEKMKDDPLVLEYKDAYKNSN